MTKSVEVVAASKSTPVESRLYKLVAAPASTPKGIQRQIVLKIMVETKEPLTVSQVTKLAETAGLRAVGGVGPSCRYHLHHLALLGIVEVTNPVTSIETVAKAA